jgi:hypothetical protein
MTGSSIRRGFGTFWMGGRLSAFEQACLSTFVARGETLTLFSFEMIENLPGGVRAGDAREIVSEAHVGSFLYQGRPNLSHFSDYFRYAMIEKAGLIWVDADILVLRSGADFWSRDAIFGKEIGGGINGAVLFFSDTGFARSLREAVETVMNRNLVWGETGPVLLNTRLQTTAWTSLALNVLYPIHHDDIGKVFLPEHLDWCNTKCKDAMTLHVFNNVICRMGYWKSMAPPAGSYLYERIKETDGLRFFQDVYPEAVMRQVVLNFRAAQTGDGLGVKSLILQAAPSVVRSFSHYAPGAADSMRKLFKARKHIN